MKMETVDEWDLLYQQSDPVPTSQVLSENLHLLPSRGVALDVACGLAENAFTLAKRGLKVDAWDNSVVAVERVNERARTLGLPVSAVVSDVLKKDFPQAYYDVIIMTHYLEQALSSRIIAALKPQGLLFFQTFTQISVSANGPNNPIYRLGSNELLSMFRALKLVVYREEAILGDRSIGFRDEAMLIGEKQ